MDPIKRQNLIKTMAATIRKHWSNEDLADLARSLPDETLVGVIQPGVLDGDGGHRPADKVPGKVVDEGVLAALESGATTMRELMRHSGYTNNQIASSLKRLRRLKKAFMAGERQLARYALTKKDAEQAHNDARAA